MKKYIFNTTYGVNVETGKMSTFGNASGKTLAVEDSLHGYGHEEYYLLTNCTNGGVKKKGGVDELSVRWVECEDVKEITSEEYRSFHRYAQWE